MKKKVTLIVALLICAILCAACSGNNSTASTESVKDISEVPVILNQAEYVLYQNIFYNQTGDDYVGKKVSKEGVFTTLTDAFTNRTRYYVWGYLDNTRCCDWQWEIVPKDPENLPANGSQVKVTGTFQASDTALDGYWITSAEITPVSRYIGEQADLNMLTMSDTLERVQLANIRSRSDAFEGKTFFAYGRIAGGDTLQDPYYDGSWQVPYTTEDTMPAIGKTVVLKGVCQGGILAESKLVKTLE